jgi:hypothetical protein
VTRTGLFRYVALECLADFLGRGWLPVADLGPVHGHWSVLCWHCQCEEREP